MSISSISTDYYDWKVSSAWSVRISGGYQFNPMHCLFAFAGRLRPDDVE